MTDGSDGSDIFVINNSDEFGRSKARLQLSERPDDWEGLYKVQLKQIFLLEQLQLNTSKFK